MDDSRGMGWCSLWRTLKAPGAKIGWRPVDLSLLGLPIRLSAPPTFPVSSQVRGDDVFVQIGRRDFEAAVTLQFNRRRTPDDFDFLSPPANLEPSFPHIERLAVQTRRTTLGGMSARQRCEVATPGAERRITTWLDVDGVTVRIEAWIPDSLLQTQWPTLIALLESISHVDARGAAEP